MKVLTWKKAPGDAVAVGELLAELETDKAVIEVCSDRAAFLRRIDVHGGDWYELGTTLALFSTSADEPLDGTAEPLSATFEAI